MWNSGGLISTTSASIRPLDTWYVKDFRFVNENLVKGFISTDCKGSFGLGKGSNMGIGKGVSYAFLEFLD